MLETLGKPSVDIKKYDTGELKKEKPEYSLPLIAASRSELKTIAKQDATLKTAAGLGPLSAPQVTPPVFGLQDLLPDVPVEHMGIAEKFGRSFAAGMGDVFYSFGEMGDFVRSFFSPMIKENGKPLETTLKDIYGKKLGTYGGGPVSATFKHVGKKMQSFADPIPVPADLQDFTWDDLASGEWWATKATRGVPFLLSLLIPGTAAAKGANFAIKGTNFLSKSGKGFQKGARLFGRKLTKSTAEKAALATYGNIAAGTTITSFDGAIIAGSAYNMALEEGLSPEVAALVGRDTWVDNSKWFAGEILSYSLIMGKMGKAFKNIYPIQKKGFSSFMRNFSIASGAALVEGNPEQFQETYQDWRVRANVAEAKGEDYMDYMTYFRSPEAKEVRGVSFALGAAFAGGATFINAKAERQRIADNQMDEVEQIRQAVSSEAEAGANIEETTRLKKQQEETVEKQFRAKLTESIADGNIEATNQVIEEWNKEQLISSEQYQNYKDISTRVMSILENVPDAGIYTKQQLTRIVDAEFNKTNALNAIEEIENSRKADLETIEQQEGVNIEEASSTINNNANKERAIWDQMIKESDTQLSTIYNEALKAEKTEEVAPEAVVAEEVTEKVTEEKAPTKRRGGRQIEKASQDLKEAKTDEKKADAITRFKNNEAAGAEVTSEEKAMFEKAEQELKDKGITIDELKVGDKLKDGDNVKVVATRTSEEYDQTENVPEEATKRVVVFVNSPQINKDGKLVKAANVTQEIQVLSNEEIDTKIAQLEKTIEVSKKLGKDTSIDENIIKELKEFKARREGKKEVKKETKEQKAKKKKAREEKQTKLESKQEEETTSKEIKETTKEEETEQLTKEEQQALDEMEKDDLGFEDDYKKEEPNKGATVSDSYLKTDGASMYTLNRLLKKIFPGLNVGILNNIIANDGAQAAGVAVGLSVFLKKGVATQLTLFHEIAHVYVKMFKNSSFVQNALKGIVGTKIYKLTKAEYAENILFTKDGKNNIKMGNLIKKINEGLGKIAILNNVAYGLKYGSKEVKEKLNKKQKLNEQEFIQLQEAYFKYVKKKVKDAGYRALPDSKQDKIQEEALVRTLEAPLLKQYDKYFDKKSQIDNNKKFTKKLFERAKNSIKKPNDALAIVQSIHPDLTNTNLQDSLAYILNDFSKPKAKRKIRFSNGFEKQFDKQERNIVQEIIKNEVLSRAALVSLSLLETADSIVEQAGIIAEQIREIPGLNYIMGKEGAMVKVTEMASNALKLKRKDIGAWKDKQKQIDNLSDQQLLDAIDSSPEGIAHLLEDEKATFSNRMSELFIEFNEKESTKENPVSLNRLISDLWKLANDNKNDVNKFIQEVETLKTRTETGKSELVRFVNFLEKSIKNEDILSSLHHEFSSMTVMSPFALYLTRDGLSERNMLSQFENKVVKDITDEIKKLINIPKGFVRKNNMQDVQAEQNRKDILNIVKELRKERIALSKKLRGLKATQKSEIRKVVNDFHKKAISFIKQITNASSRDINVDLLNYSAITIGQKTGRLYEVISTSYLDSIVEELSANEKGAYRTPYLNWVKSISQAVVLKQREENITTSILNVEGDSYQLFVKGHHIQRRIDLIHELVKTPAGRGRLALLYQGNPLIQNILVNYNQKEGRHQYKLGLSLLNGLLDTTTNSKAKYKNLSDGEYTVSNFMMLVNALSNNNKAYKQPIAVFAEKSRPYYLDNAPFYTEEQLDKIIGKSKTLPGFPQFTKEELNKQYKKLKQIFEDNVHLLEGNENFEKQIGKFSNTGKFALNNKENLSRILKTYAINKYFTQQVLLGSKDNYKNYKDFNKRAPGGIAPHIIYDRNISVEPLIFNDISEDIVVYRENGKKITLKDVNKTDSAMFILPEQAEEIRAKYGSLRPAGRVQKFVYFGVELNNEKYRGQPIYLKANAFVLSDNFVKDNPGFKPLRDALRARNKSLSGASAINVAYAESGVKLGLVKDSKGKNVNSVDLEQLNKWDKEGVLSQEINKHQNLHYRYTKKDGTFGYGFDGEGFGISNELDNNSTEATVSKQFMAALLSNQSEEGLKKANKALGHFTKSMKARMDAELGRILLASKKDYTKENIAKLRDYLLENTDSKIFDNKTRELIKTGSMSIPLLDSWAAAVLNGKIKNAGARLRVTGAILYQMSDFGFTTSERIDKKGVVTSTGLKGYRVSKAGNTIPAQIVLPANMSKRFKVGDIVTATRVPSHGKASTMVFKIHSFLPSNMGASVVIPSELSNIIGSDLDGDALHINGKYKNIKSKWQEEYNKGFDVSVKMMMEKQYLNELTAAINFEQDYEGYIDELKKEGVISEAEDLNDLFIGDNHDIYRNNVPGHILVGIVAGLNRTFNYFSAYNIGLREQDNAAGKQSLSIKIKGRNGVEKNIKSFTDKKTKDGKGNWYRLAQLVNAVLDNPKHQYIDKLGINKYNGKTAAMLIRMGVDPVDVGMILNSDAMKSWALNKEKSFGIGGTSTKAPFILTMEDLTNEIFNLELESDQQLYAGYRKFTGRQKTKDKKRPFQFQQINVKDLYSKNKNTKQKANLAVLGMIWQMERIFKDITVINHMLGVDQEIPNNAFIVRDLLDKYENIIEGNGRLSNVEKLSENPMLVNSELILTDIWNHNAIANLTYAGGSEMILQELSKQLDIDNLQDKQAFKNLHREVLSAKIASINPLINRNLEIFGQLQITNESVIETRGLDSYQVKLEEASKQLFIEVRKNSDQTMSGNYSLDFIRNYLKENIIEVNNEYSIIGDIKKGKWKGNKLVSRISLNNDISSRDLSSQEIQKARQEFEKLPPSVQAFLINYDFHFNKWGVNPASMISLFGNDTLKAITFNLEEQLKKENQEDFQYTQGELEWMAENIILNNPELIEETQDSTYRKKYDKDLNRFIIEKFDGENWNPIYFQPTGVKLGYDRAADPTELKNSIDEERLDLLDDADFMKLQDILERTHHSHTLNSMSFEEFMVSKGVFEEAIPPPETAERKLYEKEYEEYMEGHEDMVLFRSEYIDNEAYKGMSFEEVKELYKDVKKLHPLVQPAVLREVLTELGGRAAAKQVKLYEQKTGKSFEVSLETDISWMQAMFNPGLFGAKRPEIAYLMRQMRAYKKKYNQELYKEINLIRKARNVLVESKMKSLNFFGRLKFWGAQMGMNPLSLTNYTTFIYGNIVKETIKLGKLDENLGIRRHKRTVRLMSEEELGMEEGAISRYTYQQARQQYGSNLTLTKEEYNFYKMFIEMTEKYKTQLEEEGVLDDSAGKGRYYVPHVTQKNWESLMIHGSFGLYYKSLPGDVRLENIKVKGFNPVTGQTETRPYGHFREIYLHGTDIGLNKANPILSKMPKGITKRILFERIRKQAERALKDGYYINEEGKRVPVIEDMTINSGDMFDAEYYNRFTKKRSVKAELFATLDLGRSIEQYVQTQLFVHGNHHITKNGFVGMNDLNSVIDGAIGINMLHRGGAKKNENAIKFLELTIRQGFIQKKKQPAFEGEHAKTADFWIDYFVRWTMYIGLAVNVKAGVFNVAIGKYNEWRRTGRFPILNRGEYRFWGIGALAKGESPIKAMKVREELFKKYSILDYSVDDMLIGKEESKLDRLLFWTMSGSEKWIQHVAFMGEMTNKELEAFDINEEGELIVKPGYEEIVKKFEERIPIIEDDVRSVQGRGYSDVDQRLIQMYSWGRMILQYKRWLPTMIAERFAGEDIDIYGKEYIGSYVAPFDFIKNNPNPGNWMKAYKDLPEHKKKAMAHYLRGAVGVMALAILLIGLEDDDKKQTSQSKAIRRLLGDINLFFNLDQLIHLSGIPAAETLQHLVLTLFNLTPQLSAQGLEWRKYKKDSKYGKKDQLKVRTEIARLLPANSISRNIFKELSD